MRLGDLIGALEEIAPARYAQSWDNVGLLVGDAAQDVSSVLLCVDYTNEVAQEGRRLECDAVIVYHPPIFHPIRRIGADSLIFDAIRRGVAIYSPHTALDIAAGGTNDMLADVLGLTDRRPLRLIETKASQYKLVTFVPHDHVERVSSALFLAGAGRIGHYTQCSFRSVGTGTFFGEEGTSPAVGRSGQLEQAAETRLETVVPVGRVADVLDALRRSHPYEEPAFDLVQLAAPPEGIGQGRIGTMKPAPRQEVIGRIKRDLGVRQLLVAGPVDGTIQRAACCAGSCGDLLDDAMAQQAELYLSGEVRHHDALRAAAAGMTVVCTLHSNSERAVLRRVSGRLAQKLSGLALHISQLDRDPFAVM